MENQGVMNVPGDLWPVANYFMQDLGTTVDFNNPDDVAILTKGFFYLYLTIVFFTILAYKFGFAKKLPPLKSTIVYIVLIIGTFFLTLIFGLNLPVAESLIVIAAILGIYRLRLHRERKMKNSESV
ncbi:YlaH-like family protein [Aquibacillus albus]|uniref:YlaH-like protein n=1 Tax=Aquibacillus albus TaxID=1168171 RepID=A0ABS2N2A1_9BACI|nr:YlaH-like family protein [Aquibacillus albus]MBM7572237.1 hypothetical protein [Aquibacillus albus]